MVKMLKRIWKKKNRDKYLKIIGIFKEESKIIGKIKIRGIIYNLCL